MYKERHGFGVRQRESLSMRRRYTNRIPIIIEPKGIDTPQVDRRKYMTPERLTFGELFHVVRKRLSLRSDQALFFFVENGTLLLQSHTVQEIYERHRDEDGFLYISYTLENTFGTVPPVDLG